MIYRIIAMICGAVILSGCGGAKVPKENVAEAAGVPSIYPDYTDVVIPPNIAPMNFEISLPGNTPILCC